MIRPLRKYHRIIWIILAILLSAGFVIAFILSRKFEKFYEKELTIHATQIEEKNFLKTKIVTPYYERVL